MAIQHGCDHLCFHNDGSALFSFLDKVVDDGTSWTPYFETYTRENVWEGRIHLVLRGTDENSDCIVAYDGGAKDEDRSSIVVHWPRAGEGESQLRLIPLSDHAVIGVPHSYQSVFKLPSTGPALNGDHRSYEGEFQLPYTDPAAMEDTSTPVQLTATTEQPNAEPDDQSTMLVGNVSQALITELEDLGYTSSDIEAASKAASKAAGSEPDRFLGYVLNGIPENVEVGQRAAQEQNQQDQQQVQAAQAGAATGSGPTTPADAS